ncbi:putative RING-H2 finger protein ATL21A [Neltuma alba]|uniref:putative RING-H2 finger protein ATL21A n=1 Tax=Neltuma alba TaxID=207710 RepID=UPI0010A2CA8E|nr:putative RING-H2 finger protein ATL21A [Prosopis alba]
MLHLPHAGDFLVDLISYEEQKLWIRDPDDCLPRRFMNKEFNFTDSTFQLSDDYSLMDFTFFNCSSNVTWQYRLRPIPCLSSDLNQNYSVVAVWSDPPFPTPGVEWCEPISSVTVPFSITNTLYSVDRNAHIGLQWNTPSCGACVAKNGRCEFLKNTGLEVACYLPHQGGLSKFASYGLGFGVGIPGLLSVIGIVYMCKGRRRRNEDGRQSRNIELNNVAGWSSIVVMGLDGESIDKYPMTRIGDSGRLPDPNNNVCSICLSDYQPQDSLRTIPDCNHYFHANCIDSWLRMNATCPLCRKLPHHS